jgi:hypothetical protein
MTGFFTVDRRMFDHPMFKPEKFCERAAWLWLLREAQWTAGKVRVGRAVIELERGQLAHSRRFIARAWGWDESAVRRVLTRWEKYGAINPQTTRDATIITICNYDEYQLGRPTDDQQPDPQTTHNRPTSDPKYKKEIIEEGKKEKKERGPRGKPRTPIAEDWAVTDKGHDYARKSGFDEAKIADMGRRFFNHHTSRGSLMADWEAAWRTWCDNEIKFNANRTVIPMRGPPNRAPSFHEIARDLSPRNTDDDSPDAPNYDLDLRAYPAH